MVLIILIIKLFLSLKLGIFKIRNLKSGSKAGENEPKWKWATDFRTDERTLAKILHKLKKFWGSQAIQTRIPFLKKKRNKDAEKQKINEKICFIHLRVYGWDSITNQRGNSMNDRNYLADRFNFNRKYIKTRVKLINSLSDRKRKTTKEKFVTFIRSFVR